MPGPSVPPNVFLLAADASPALLPLLRRTPALAASQDEHGYTLVHAAASYNQLVLLRALIQEFDVDVNMVDEDGETALFSVETVAAARCLIEELGVDRRRLNHDGASARERLEAEEDFMDVVAYLRSLETHDDDNNSNTDNATTSPNAAAAAAAAAVVRSAPLPPLPPNVEIDFARELQAPADDAVVDPDFRRRIEELAAREDFQGEEGQKELRDLITEAVRGHVVGGAPDAQGRETRRRVD